MTVPTSTPSGQRPPQPDRRNPPLLDHRDDGGCHSNGCGDYGDRNDVDARNQCRHGSLAWLGKSSTCRRHCRPDSQKSAHLADRPPTSRHKFVPDTFFCVRDCRLSPNFLHVPEYVCTHNLPKTSTYDVGILSKIRYTTR